MAQKTYLKAKSQKLLKLVVTKQFRANLKDIMFYGTIMFGEKVVTEFYREIINKIIILPKMPNIYARSRFIESTQDKTYRNIVARKYYIIYSVSKTTIRIIDIVHQATNPETITKIK